MKQSIASCPFKIGDNVSSESMATGKYLGVDEFNGEEFHKVYDHSTRLTLYISLNEIGKLRALPSENIVRRYLKAFHDKRLIDSDLIEGSRYKYFKSKLERVNFKDTFEVLHDLHILFLNKKISTSERRIYKTLKAKVLGEISYILGVEHSDLEQQYLAAS
jgi:RNA polymerase-interacting CarD/CdnL/TRCF family regulator